MSDKPQPPGPDPNTLRNLHAMLPSYIRGLAKRRIGGKGKPALVSKPRKICKVCCTAFDHAMLRRTDDTEMQADLCERCKAYLDGGGIALVCGDKFALVKCPVLDAWAGTIQQVSPHVMEQVETRFCVLNQKPNEPDNPPAS